MRTIVPALLSLSVLAACSTDVGSSSEYSTDTFAKPTHHGELEFEAKNRASVTNSQRFHGWSFTLTADATVTLKTELRTPNLDTMLYLYKADESGKKQGANIKKDDNGGEDGISSLIEKELSAGTYFIQVKTKNVNMRGDFDLDASCLGAGCPVDEPPAAEDYCWGAHESIGKCMDDGYEESECAPSDSDAILCCNSFENEEWFCEDLCIDGELEMARVWNDDYDRAFEVYPEDDYSGLMDTYALAVNTCASPDMNEVAADIVSGQDLTEDSGWDTGSWIERDDADFFSWEVTEDLMSVLDHEAGEKATMRFESTIEVPCPNCTDGFRVHGFWYPTAGKVVVLETRWGWDS